MDSRERVKLALNHKEPDQVPYDMGSGISCDIAVKAYENLLKYLGIEIDTIRVADITAQTTQVDEIVCQKLGIDFRPIRLKPPSIWKREIKEEESYYWFTDEWGVKWKMPKTGGFYYDMVSFPLANAGNADDIDDFKWPDPNDPARFEGLVETCKYYEENVDATLVLPDRLGNGFLQMGPQLFGFDNWFRMLVSNTKLVEKYLEKYLEFKMQYWGSVLSRIGDKLSVVCELDDLGTQNGPFISLAMYRKYIKPRQKKLFSFIKKNTDAKIYFHSCGSVYNFIPDLIEAGIDILNPIQYSAKNMEQEKIKKEFGKDLVLWGGGLDTQRILPHGSKQEIADEVKRNIDIFAPGGGYVFAQVHNIQADIPPENIIAMLEAFQKYNKY